MKKISSIVLIVLSVALVSHAEKVSLFDSRKVPSFFEGMEMIHRNIKSAETPATYELLQIYSYFRNNSLNDLIKNYQQPKDISTGCKQQVDALTDALLNGSIWALEGF
jgi:hypothetical protein